MLIFFFGSLGGGRFFSLDRFFFTCFVERISVSLGRGDRFDIVEAFIIAYLSSDLLIWNSFFFSFFGG